MAQVLVSETNLTDIANAIRNKNNTTVSYKPGEMAAAINSISGEGVTLQEKTVTPTTSKQVVTANASYSGLSKVTVNAVDSSIDSDIIASNIKEGVNILGVTGTLKESVAEDLGTELNTQNTLLSTQETTIDDIIVALQGKATGGGEISLQEKTVTPSTSQQSITADSSYNGLSKVTVNAVTSAIDSDIKAGNIKKGINILGVTGTLEEGSDPVLQSKTISPSTSSQTITPDSNYDGLSKVTVNAVTSAIDSDIKAGNIKKGINILGVTGTLEEGITPSGTLNITSNGTYNVTNYASASVNVSGGSNIDEEIYRSLISMIDGSAGVNCTKLPSDLNCINDGSFYLCYNLALEELPDSVNYIGTDAFYFCYDMPLTKLPSSLEYIGPYAFYECINLAITSIPSGVTDIEYGTFCGCTNLTTIDITASSLGYIDGYAFQGCSNLSSVIIRSGNIPTLEDSDAFENTPIASGAGYIYVQDALVNWYKTATNWSVYSSKIKGISELGG